jgi:Secretion system C-terminal sorting domain/Dockerin type I domain
MTRRLTHSFFTILMLFSINAAKAQLMNCNNHTNISMGPSCTTVITADMVSTGSPVGSTVMVLNGNNIVPQPLNNTHVGKIYTVKVTSPAGNACWGTIKIEDKFPPVLTCATSPQNVNCAISNFNLSTVQKVVFDNIPNSIPDIDITATTFGVPTVTENCGLYSLSYNDVVDDKDCNAVGLSAVVLRTWEAVDLYGNKSFCTILYNFQRQPLTALVFPADVTLSCDNNFAKDANGNPNVSVTNVPKINGTNAFPTMAGFCEINTQYHDTKINTCGNTYEVLRKWTAVDMCNATTTTKIQVIKIVDITAPIFAACPTSALFVPANGNQCDLDNYSVPLLAITDNCDAKPTLTAQILQGGAVVMNGLNVNNLPIGNYVVRYYATDACGNATTCERNMEVKDIAPPVAVCDLNTKVSLTSDGTAILPAIDVDDNSTDNCCVDINRFEIKRAADNDATYAPTLTLSCADITLMVALRVWDCHGNNNVCMVNVLVEDKLPPIITAQDTTVLCGDNTKAFTWLNAHQPQKKTTLIDIPTANNPGYYDNCDATVSFVDNKNIDNCGNGSYTRTWTAKDAGGRVATTVQKYISTNRSTFTVAFPKDTLYYSTAACDKIETNPDNTGKPKIVVTNGTCPLLGVEYTDEIFNIGGEESCYKIIRTWKILNWCKNLPAATTLINNNPNGAFVIVNDNDNGYLEYKQLIKVVDKTPPTVVFKSFKLEAVGKECKAKLTIEKPDVTDCSNETIFYYSIEDEKGKTFAQSTTFPGEYTFTANDFGKKFIIKYTAGDKCGNVATTTQTVTIKDVTKPTPVCHHWISTNLMANQMVMIDAKLLDAGSYDNCTPQGKLKFKIQYPAPSANNMPNPDTLLGTYTFTCGDTAIIPFNDQFGYLAVVGLWVGDEAGNWDYCETIVHVQDNNIVCDYKPIQMKNLAGAFKTKENNPIESVTIDMNGSKQLKTTTDNTGLMLFKDLPTSGIYILKPEKNTNPLNGVSTLDLVLMSKHILGAQPLSSPCQLIAADVNKSGTVSTADIVELRKMILGIQSNFTKNTAWRFVDKNFVFDANVNPLQVNLPESAQVKGLKGTESVDFIGIKIGDINGNAQTTGNAAGRDEKPTMRVFANDKKYQKDELVTVTFNAENAIEGYQMTLNFDKNNLELLNIDGDNDNFAVLENGIMTASVINNAKTNVMFSLTFKAKKAGIVSENIRISSDVTTAEVIENQSLIKSIALSFDQKVKTSDDLILFQNRPNPFQNETVVSFQLPTNGAATLSIMDINGRMIKQYSSEYQKGYNELKINKNDLNTSGVVYLLLEQNGKKVSKKMIIVE